MTEIQELNEDLRICDYCITFTKEAATPEWCDKEVATLHAKIKTLAEEIGGVHRKHREAPSKLKLLYQRREKLTRLRSINTDAAIKRLLELQKEVRELQDVDAS